MTGVSDSVDVSIEVYGGLVTDESAAVLPHGVSPDCQDCGFLIGSVSTRPGVTSQYTLAGGPSVQYMKSFQVETVTPKIPRFLSLDSLGVLRKDVTPGGALTPIYSGILPGSFCKSTSLFGREYFAFGNGVNGYDMPRQYDDTNLDRLTQVGAGLAPTVVDGAAGNIPAGLHQLSVIFVTRSGAYLKPPPPVNWTAAGAKKANVTNIPVGPPNVVARILTFTGANLASFYHLGPRGLTLAGSNMYIADNTTTTLTVDFSDDILLKGTSDDDLFNQIELPPVAGILGYSNRLFSWGEQGNLQNFLNLTFDGGFAGTPATGNTGVISPTIAVNDGPVGNTAWLNPGNVFAADGVLATAALPGLGNTSSQYIKATGYITGVPANATITGIVVNALVKGPNFNISDNSVRLYQNGVLVGTNHANGNAWGSVLAYQTYGSSVDSWGVSFVPGDAIGVAFSATNNSGSGGTQTASVDYISIQVYYTTPGVGTLPLGWTAGASVAGGSSALTGIFPVVWGDAYAITGDGATAIRGQITQNAATNYLTNPVLLPGTAYGVRARVASAGGLVQGTLHVNLQSASGAFTTAGLSVQAGQATASYKLFTAILLTSALATIPTDLLLQVYADGTPTNNGTFLIDNIEIYPLNQQFNNSYVRASRGQSSNAASGQESYDSQTGLIAYNLNDGQAVRTCFKLRERFFIVKEHSFGATQDDGINEPSLWKVDDVSTEVGTPSVNGVGLGEGWVAIAHRTGLYLYWGGEVLKISQEIQPTWDSINWVYGWTISVTVDTRKRKIYICAPFGSSTIPNKTLVLDYHDVGSDAEAIAANPPIHLTFQGTKKAFDRARKWCPWTVPANCIAQIELANGKTGIYFGSNDASGHVNLLDDTGLVFTDNGATIPFYYVTAAFAELPTEEAKMLRSHRHLYTYLTVFVQGVGQLGITVYLASLANGVALNPQALVSAATKDTEMALNQSTERMFIKFSSSGNGQFVDLQTCCVSMRPEPWSIVRGQ